MINIIKLETQFVCHIIKYINQLSLRIHDFLTINNTYNIRRDNLTYI